MGWALAVGVAAGNAIHQSMNELEASKKKGHAAYGGMTLYNFPDAFA